MWSTVVQIKTIKRLTKSKTPKQQAQWARRRLKNWTYKMYLEMQPPYDENAEIPLVYLTGQLYKFYVDINERPGNFVQAVSFSENGSRINYYIMERDYRQFERQMESEMDTITPIPEQLVRKAVYYQYKKAQSPLARLGSLLFWALYIAVILHIYRNKLPHTIFSYTIRDLLDFLDVAMTIVFEIIMMISYSCYNAIWYLSYSFTTSLFQNIASLVHWMPQSAFHLILWTITASLTFMIDNVLLIIGLIIFLLIGLGYFILIYGIKKLLETNAAILEVQAQQKSDLKQVKENLTFEKGKNCANLNEIEKLKLRLKENDNLILTLRDINSDLDSQKNRMKLQLQETDKLNSKLELEKKELQFRAEKNTKQNDIQKSEKVKLKSEQVKLKSEKEEIGLKFKEVKKLNVMLERTGLQLESQNEKFKLELEREKDQRLCNVCTEKYKDILLLPCKHFSLCKTCLDKLNLNKTLKCPICREGIESTIDVYIS